MKIQLVKGETKETFGEGENSFDYWHRPLTVEEKQNINSGVVWKTSKGNTSVDFAKTDLFDLLRLAVTRIERLFDSDGAKIGTINELLNSTPDAGQLDGIAVSMWVTIWTSINLSEELKKKL